MAPPPEQQPPNPASKFLNWLEAIGKQPQQQQPAVSVVAKTNSVIGSIFSNLIPSTNATTTTTTTNPVDSNLEPDDPANVLINSLMERSAEFYSRFPVGEQNAPADTTTTTPTTHAAASTPTTTTTSTSKVLTDNRISKVLAEPQKYNIGRVKLAGFAETTRPVVHARVTKLMEAYVQLRLMGGRETAASEVEREILTSSCSSPEEFVVRLLTKRPVVFRKPDDQFFLSHPLPLSLDDQRDGDRDTFEFGTLNNSTGVNNKFLSDLISYDEMAISALVLMSTPTVFVTTGHRNSAEGYHNNRNNVPEGVLIGACGARFNRHGRMEFAHMMVSPEQNNDSSKGYGSVEKQRGTLLELWARLYDVPFFHSYDQVVDMQKKDPKTFAATYVEIRGSGSGGGIVKSMTDMVSSSPSPSPSSSSSSSSFFSSPNSLTNSISTMFGSSTPTPTGDTPTDTPSPSAAATTVTTTTTTTTTTPPHFFNKKV